MTGERDILQVLAVYQQRLAEFKREMEDLGIKVQVSASLGKWTSTVEVDRECPSCGYLEWTTVTRQGRRGNTSIVDVGYRCDRCGHEWGFEYFKEETQKDA